MCLPAYVDSRDSGGCSDEHAASVSAAQRCDDFAEQVALARASVSAEEDGLPPVHDCVEHGHLVLTEAVVWWCVVLGLRPPGSITCHGGHREVWRGFERQGGAARVSGRGEVFLF